MWIWPARAHRGIQWLVRWRVHRFLWIVILWEKQFATHGCWNNPQMVVYTILGKQNQIIFNIHICFKHILMYWDVVCMFVCMCVCVWEGEGLWVSVFLFVCPVSCQGLLRALLKTLLKMLLTTLLRTLLTTLLTILLRTLLKTLFKTSLTTLLRTLLTIVLRIYQGSYWLRF